MNVPTPSEAAARHAAVMREAGEAGGGPGAARAGLGSRRRAALPRLAGAAAVAAWVLGTGLRAAQPCTASFDDGTIPPEWQTSGPVAVDTAIRRGETGGALRIEPGGRALWRLRDTDGAGTVEFWVYDDGSAPASPRERLTGPYYGLFQTDGRVLAPGSLYAPYLSGDTSYAITAFNPDAGEQHYMAVQYLGIPRTPGWHRWSFEFDPEKGVTVRHDGKDVNQPRERFQWYRTRVTGFAGVVFAGDATPDRWQTLWVDDVSVTLAGPMKVTPEQSAPPPLTPEQDPAPETPAALVEPLRGVHPRLLFTADEIPAMRERIREGYGKTLFERLLAYLPSCTRPEHTNFLKDATDAQRQGLWRLPTVALHYVLTGDRQSFDRTVAFMDFLLGLDHWETGELDCGMGAANLLAGAALAYDWLHGDLDPAFRARFRDKLLLMARRMYHHGHLAKLPGNHYWQGDPANNHRFHRDAGLVLAALAVAEEGNADDDWLLARTLEEIRFVVEWLPADGSCHESPTYSVFGNTHLMLAVDAAQRCFGERFLDHPFFRQAPLYKLQTMRPDLQGSFGYGDSGSGTGGYHNYLHRACAYHGLADLQAGIAEAERRNQSFFDFAWFSILWWRPLPGGSLAAVPLHAFFPDVGLAICRTGWEPADVGAMFKCGPFGGYELNRYRQRRGMAYVNVAHDDPDANSFQIFAQGAMLAETDRYSNRKRSANHNTILINGAGQVTAGRPEGAGWSQPGGDMARMAVITACARNDDGAVAVEGEAAGSYLANPRGGPKRPALDRFRRAFVWVPGRYILVLDDIRAPEPVEVTWLIQGPELKTLDAAGGRYALASGGASCPFQVTATETLSAEVADSPADDHGKPLGWKQLQLKARTASLRLASVYDPWRRDGLSLTLQPAGPDRATVTVAGPQGADTWEWTAGEGRFGPSRIAGRTPDGRQILLLQDPEPETRRLLERIAAETPAAPPQP